LFHSIFSKLISSKQESGQDERAWFFSFKEKRAKTVSERIFHAGENSRVFVSTDLILFTALLSKNGFLQDLPVSMPVLRLNNS